MSIQRARRHPALSVQLFKQDACQSQPPGLFGASTLSPDLQPSTPPTFSSRDEPAPPSALKIGNYLLLGRVDSVGSVPVYNAVDVRTDENFICKVLPVERYRELLTPYWRVGHHDHINQIREVILGGKHAYVVFPPHYGDLHSYVRSLRRVREADAARLFAQIASVVDHCHSNGVILRDVKLRKFVFKDAAKTELKFEGLEDACIFDDDDRRRDKNACPAYVSPEILQFANMGSAGTSPSGIPTSSRSYSGRAADVWGLGVVLYTMLVGRYPFHDADPATLFALIRRAQYAVPDVISIQAKCLLRNLLRRDPDERLTADTVVLHPWLKRRASVLESIEIGGQCGGVEAFTGVGRTAAVVVSDQIVPQVSPLATVTEKEDIFMD